jgi:hypothetical protein
VIDLTQTFYDRSGVEITEAEHVAIDRRVARDAILSGVVVSTTFFGYRQGRVAVMFETMVILDDGEELNCKRTATETEARIAHIEMVEWARNYLGLEVP